MNKVFDKKRKKVSKNELIDSLKTSIDKNESALNFVNELLSVSSEDFNEKEIHDLQYIELVLHKVNNLYVESLNNVGVLNYGKVYE